MKLMLQEKGIALPEQWSTIWRKADRKRFYAQARKWPPERIQSHNHAINQILEEKKNIQKLERQRERREGR